MNRNIFLVSILSACFLTPALASAQDDAPEYTIDGLKLVDKSRRGEIYADPEMDWSVYSEVILDRPTVAFRKYWQRDQNRNRTTRVDAQDMERIKNELANLFEEVFTEAGYPEGAFTTLLIGSSAVERVIADPRVVAVTLTGSEPAGSAVAATLTINGLTPIFSAA